MIIKKKTSTWLDKFKLGTRFKYKHLEIEFTMDREKLFINRNWNGQIAFSVHTNFNSYENQTQMIFGLKYFNPLVRYENTIIFLDNDNKEERLQ